MGARQQQAHQRHQLWQQQQPPPGAIVGPNPNPNPNPYLNPNPNPNPNQVGGEVQIMVGGIDQSGTFSPLCSTLKGLADASQPGSERGGGTELGKPPDSDSMVSPPVLKAEAV